MTKNKSKRPRIDKDLYISDRDRAKGYTYEDVYNSSIAVWLTKKNK